MFALCAQEEVFSGEDSRGASTEPKVAHDIDQDRQSCGRKLLDVVQETRNSRHRHDSVPQPGLSSPLMIDAGRHGVQRHEDRVVAEHSHVVATALDRAHADRRLMSAAVLN
jgi:hypothetical protein